jgi:hypothetical protein
MSIEKIARQLSLGVGTVARVLKAGGVFQRAHG